MTSQAPFGVIGKHPGYGDFLQWGVSENTVEALTRWCDATLPPLRDQMGEAWGPFWDNAHEIRFWIGRAVLGRTLVGVYRPSRDRVGRRFPLICLCENASVPAPLAAGDQTPWEGIEAHMSKMQAGQGAKALMEGAAIPIEAEDAELSGVGPTLWAHHPEGNLDALLRKAAEVDLYRAQLTRSYWWAPARDGQAPIWLGCPGLPETGALGWLLGGVPAEVPA